METKENQLRNKTVNDIGLISFAKKIVIQEKKNATIYIHGTVIVP